MLGLPVKLTGEESNDGPIALKFSDDDPHTLEIGQVLMFRGAFATSTQTHDISPPRVGRRARRHAQPHPDHAES